LRGGGKVSFPAGQVAASTAFQSASEATMTLLGKAFKMQRDLQRAFSGKVPGNEMSKRYNLKG
jgi:ribulose 1,5-bisphosphate carboxylase large subunit-like protein